MKKLLFLLLAVGMIFFATACTTANSVAQTVVTLPEPIRNAILIGVTVALAWVVTQLAGRFPWLGGFLGQYVDEAAVAIAGAVTLAIQAWLNAVPPQWEGVVNSALALVVAILAAYGFIKGAR